MWEQNCFNLIAEYEITLRQVHSKRLQKSPHVFSNKFNEILYLYSAFLNEFPAHNFISEP